MTQDQATSNSGHGRLQGLLLAALFLGSLGLAFVLYYGLDWAPGAAAAHGRLIHPARPLQAFSAPVSDGGEFRLDDLRGRWNVVFVNDGPCTDACRDSLLRLRQVWLTFGRDMQRLHTIVVLDSAVSAVDAGLRAVHPDLTAVRADESLMRQLRAAAPLAVAGSVLLIDPLGNLMMQYPGDFEQKGLQADLKRLLKYSHIG